MKHLFPIFLLLPLVGCGPTARIHHYNDLQNPQTVTAIEERSLSFFASENLQMFYEADIKAREAHDRTARHTVDKLLTLHATAQYANSESQTFAAMLYGRMMSDVSSYRGTGNAAPKTMADQNWPAWGGILSDWGMFFLRDNGGNRRSGSPDLEITGDRNLVFYDSQIGTGEGSGGQFWFGDYQETLLDISGPGSSGSFDASKPFTQSESTTTTTTTTRDDTKTDGSLF